MSPGSGHVATTPAAIGTAPENVLGCSTSDKVEFFLGIGKFTSLLGVDLCSLAIEIDL